MGIAVPVVALLAEPRLLEEVASLLTGREVQRGFAFERALLRFWAIPNPRQERCERHRAFVLKRDWV